ncbi:hypothetical protein KIN20_025443 [Parelaphostrongylus tenuis]|uniref:Uncharacterized protein n=1 Tax=Parelaphostrongylus tenuis TaxID=148309 RepID=A0AAD5MV93_PARTN|nr:hypothetical protein KIN20_025443 [Parelaphostrongylus tenuis]
MCTESSHLRFADLAHFKHYEFSLRPFMKEVPRLDILICNAGIFTSSSLYENCRRFRKNLAMQLPRPFFTCGATPTFIVKIPRWSNYQRLFTSVRICRLREV